MEVPLDGAYRPSQCLGQGLHLGPAQPRLVVGVVGEGAVGRYGLGGDYGVGEVLDLGDTGKFGLVWHCRLLLCSAAVRFDDKIHQSGGLPGKRKRSAAFSMHFFCWVLYLHGHPRASPWLCAIAPVLTAQARTAVPLPNFLIILCGRPFSPG